MEQPTSKTFRVSFPEPTGFEWQDSLVTLPEGVEAILRDLARYPERQRNIRDQYQRRIQNNAKAIEAFNYAAVLMAEEENAAIEAGHVAGDTVTIVTQPRLLVEHFAWERETGMVTEALVLYALAHLGSDLEYSEEGDYNSTSEQDEEGDDEYRDLH